MLRYAVLCLALLSLIPGGHTLDEVKEVSPQELTSYVVDHRLTGVFVCKYILTLSLLKLRMQSIKTDTHHALSDAY